MTDVTPARDAFVAAAAAALEPFAWRSLTKERVARRAIGAVDRHIVHELLQSKAACRHPEGRRGGDPAGRSDERVDVLVGFLSEHRWRTWTLPFLAQQLMVTLDAWWTSRQRLEVELTRMGRGSD